MLRRLRLPLRSDSCLFTFAKLLSLPGQANGGKETFRRFCDSVLQKSAKVRSLVSDLKRNYVDDMATKSYSQYLHELIAIYTMNFL